MNLSADISRRRYSDSEDKSSRPRILQGTLLLELDRKLKLPSGLLLNHWWHEQVQQADMMLIQSQKVGCWLYFS
jgi:hypothetical protein